MSFPALTSPTEPVTAPGWYRPLSARSFHYFSGWRSACGRWTRSRAAVAAEPSNENRCGKCAQVVAARDVAIGDRLLPKPTAKRTDAVPGRTPGATVRLARALISYCTTRDVTVRLQLLAELVRLAELGATVEGEASR